MPRTSIQLGFHRLGIALGGVLAVIVGGFGLGVAIMERVDGRLPIAMASAFVLAALAYGLCRLVGWIVEGFMGGGRPIASPASPSSGPGTSRRWIVVILEGSLLAIVVVAVIYFVMVGLNDARPYGDRLFAWWVAAVLVLISGMPLIERAIPRGRGEGAETVRGLVLLPVGLSPIFGLVTWFFAATAAFKGGGREDIGLAILIMLMIAWPDIRHRILSGAWKPGLFSPQR